MTASGLSTSKLPPNANCTSFHSAPASASAARIASAPMSMADLAPKRPKGCRPTPMMATSSMSALPRARPAAKAKVMTSVPSGSVRNGTITSSTSMPMRSFVGVALGQPALDPHLVAELHHARRRRAGTSPASRRRRRAPSGRNSWVVNVHSVPRRGRRCCSTSTDPHRAHDGCTGNVTAAHARAPAADELRLVGRPGEDVRGEGDLAHRATLSRAHRRLRTPLTAPCAHRVRAGRAAGAWRRPRTTPPAPRPRRRPGTPSGPSRR